MFGGLGNQLFIYAFNRVLSLKHNVPLQFDVISGMKKDTYKRKFALDYFSTKIKKCNLIDSTYFVLNKRSTGLTKIFYPNSFYLNEKNYRSDVLNYKIDRSKEYYTEGNWQSYRYFQEYEDILRKDLEFDFLIIDELQLQTVNIENIESVSVHFRRKDYTRLVDLDYYHNAISIIRNKIKNPIFFIFSDDPAWVKDNFVYDKNDTSLVITNNEISDFYLMSKCKYHIISNSTFAWWASWLGKSDNKIIIAPPPENWPDKNVLYPELIIN